MLFERRQIQSVGM